MIVGFNFAKQAVIVGLNFAKHAVIVGFNFNTSNSSFFFAKLVILSD